MFVVDSADKVRLKEAKKELLNINSEAGLENVPLLVLANKQDVEDCMSEEELSEALGLAAMPKQNMGMHACSAKAGVGVWEGIAKLSELMAAGCEKDDKSESAAPNE